MMNKFTFSSHSWIKIALINFCIVALAGVTLRYKINFDLRAVNQKHLLYAHSNFAFVGWVTIILMVLMIDYIGKYNVATNFKKYHWLLIANCFTAYGMFVSFIIQGYDFYSILFLSAGILLSYFFIVWMWKDLNKVEEKSYATIWYKAGLIIWAFSSLGAILLAYLMARNILIQDLYFASVYFFLHFQYNGWFLFVCFGLLFSFLLQQGYLPSVAISKKLFMILAITVVPAFFLSILWLKLPPVIQWVANVTGILQLVVLLFFVRIFSLFKNSTRHILSSNTRILWLLASVAFILKIVLQMLSIFPYLSNYAFGFRPVVIGYLHLSFLGIISFFILGYINQLFYQRSGRQLSVVGVFVFIGGVIIQEVILMFQGLEAMNFSPLPHANILLFYCAILIALGLILLVFSIKKPKELIRN
ncbi:MAG: hypothetical protein JSS98_01830 [Bacteroidetes bacterium]|nr:hypothetical protein [Bacteroidota bacterium]